MTGSFKQLAKEIHLPAILLRGQQGVQRGPCPLSRAPAGREGETSLQGMSKTLGKETCACKARRKIKDFYSVQMLPLAICTPSSKAVCTLSLLLHCWLENILVSDVLGGSGMFSSCHPTAEPYVSNALPERRGRFMGCDLCVAVHLL